MLKSTTWRFGGFVYGLSFGLKLGGNSVHLARKERSLLELLLHAKGTLVSKDQIVHSVWDSGAVSDESLSRCVYRLRRALQRPDGHDIVKTVYGDGLRICVPVIEGTEDTQVDPYIPPPASSPTSIRLWRMGWEQAGGRSRSGLERAQVTFQRAYEDDPTSLVMPLTMIECRILQMFRGYLVPTAAAEAAGQVIAEVLKQAPGYPPAIACQALFRAVVDRQISVALTELDWAVQAMPHDYRAGFCRAWVLGGVGRLDEAMREIERWIQSAWPDRGYAAVYAWMLFCARRFDDALNYGEGALRERPENDLLYEVISSIHALRGNVDEAIEAAVRAVDLLSSELTTEAQLAYAYAVAGRSTDALNLLQKFEGQNDSPGPVYKRVAVWLALGYPERAVACLRASDDRREPQFFFAQHDPRLAALGSLPPIRDAS